MLIYFVFFFTCNHINIFISYNLGFQQSFEIFGVIITLFIY